jgi:hypothetical protein
MSLGAHAELPVRVERIDVTSGELIEQGVAARICFANVRCLRSVEAEMPEPSRTARNDLMASSTVIRASPTALATSATGTATTAGTTGADHDPAVSQAAMIAFASAQAEALLGNGPSSSGS